MCSCPEQYHTFALRTLYIVRPAQFVIFVAMKKALLLLWTIFYLGTASGAIVHLHYCMGRIIGWGLFESRPGDTCPNCGMHKKPGNNCCKDVPQCLQAGKQEPVMTATSLPSLPDQLPVILPYSYSRYTATALTTRFPNARSGFRGPPGPEVPVFLRNCVFRI